MEKVIYLLWKEPEQTVVAWRDAMRGAIGRSLRDNGARRLQVDLVDEAVAPGEELRIISRSPPDGVLMFWLPTANDRASCESVLRETHSRIAGYLVTESCIKEGVGYCAPDARTPGFALIGFLQRPSRLDEEEWLHRWLDHHTRVAVDTQSTFRYVQNVVARVLTDDAPVLDALVEEGFPIAALTDRQAFYDAVGDEEKYQRNLTMMVESCQRFIDFERLDSIPMSEYFIGADVPGQFSPRDASI